MRYENINCPICGGLCALHDVVDFNKSCEEQRGKFLPLAGVPIYYVLCDQCGFCFSPEMCQWNLDEFADRVYNDEYILVDPDYVESRPKAFAASLQRLFGDHIAHLKHLDYGGGNGILVKTLKDYGWESVSYDPFEDRGVDPARLGDFNLVTAIEVFEHVPDVDKLMSDLRSLLSPGGLIMFTTLLSDGSIVRNQRISWWYASPRNGHISLFSRNSLERLAQKNGFKFFSFSPGTHAFFNDVPSWASHIIRSA